MESSSSVRVDSWLWAVRQYKTRSAATTACRAGHIRVGGERVKPSHNLRVGNEVRVRVEGFDRVLIVDRLIVKRVGAPLAAECYVDATPERLSPIDTPAAITRERGAGRPTKRERRDLEKLRGRSDDDHTGITRLDE